jgi:hypothetical protein
MRGAAAIRTMKAEDIPGWPKIAKITGNAKN